MTENFKIEKGIQIPETRGTKSKYPWKTMIVGDSFFVEAAMKSVRYKTIQSAAYRSGKKIGRKFTTRFIDGGLRVWRTE